MSFNFITGTNWLLIFSLVFGSAGLAALGDVLGFRYGKQRISLFGLRPKYTGRLITAITGALIAVFILGVMSVFSQDVRTALFGMKYIEQQIYDLSLKLRESEESAEQTRASLVEASTNLELTGFELDSMKNDKLILEQEKSELEASLRIMREESEQLKQDLKSMRSEAIALSANVLLGQTYFETGMTREEVIKKLDNLKQQVRLNILARISNQTFTRLRNFPIEFNQSEEENIINEIISSQERRYVRALSNENYTFGNNMQIQVRLESGTSVLIYDEGGIVYRKFFMNDKDSRITPEEILHTFLRELKIKVIDDGILPEPATNNVGTLDGEAFFNAVENLNKIKTSVIINAIAKNDIYTEGPVVIDIIFETEDSDSEADSENESEN